MEELYEPIVPNELIVGITGRMSYVTYRVNNKLNSEKSWKNWSDNSDDPLIIKNKFSAGFKLGEVNSRYSRQAANAENLVIIHPLFDKGFEISLNRFIEIANRTTIINGVIQDELIMDKHRNILFRDEYEKLVKEHKNKAQKQKQTLEKNKEKKVKSSNQIPGRFYIDIKTNNEYCYLGTATIDNVLKHIYIESNAVKSVHKTENVTVSVPGFLYRNTKVESLVYPSICYVSGKNYQTKEEYLSCNNRYYFSQMYGYMRMTKTKISMSESTKTNNIYDTYTEKDWEIVDKCYTKKFHNNEEILKGNICINNFRQDYLNCKENDQ